jgi:hypothetical protein
LLLAAVPAGAAHRCLPCHAPQVAGYAGTDMANSVGIPRSQPGGSFRHALSGTGFRILSDAGGMRHRVARGGLDAEYQAAYFIGSGHEGRSYAVRIGAALFQSPAAWYARRRAWDLSPGYEPDRHPDFTRRIAPECLFCHANGPAAEPQPISCERCHGPAEAHLARPGAGSIVNPAKLPPRLRDSVCEQCHLSGEARILHPAATLDDFRPGRALEEVLTVYVREEPESGLKVVSHAEQLARSACAKGSAGRLWCGSCHDPHAKPADPAADYRARCLACHPAMSAGHAPASRDCAGCHMQVRAAYDGAHTAFTDHRILRRPAPEPAGTPSWRLAAWREPAAALAQRALGLAYVAAGERSQSAERLNEGFRLLSALREPVDADVLTALGLVLLRKEAPTVAARLFARAVRERPTEADAYLNLAAARHAAGNTAQAIADLERALELDPYLQDAYMLMARMGPPERRRRVLERYLSVMPQHLEARRALRGLP